MLRDEWITLKAASELAVGKESNNGVSYGKGQTLIEPFTKPEKSDLDANVGYLNQLVENTDADVYFALLPEKSEIWADRLPARTPNDSEAEVIEYCYGLSNAHNVDVLSAMREHAGRVYLLPDRPPLDQPRRLLRLYSDRRGHGA